MRFSKIVVVSISLLGLSLPAWSQQPEGPAAQGIPGYLDPRTGAFKPMAKAPAEESTLLLTPTGGDFKVAFTITVKSSIGATAPISCTFFATVFDVGSGLTMTDSMTVAATGSGGSRTCTLDMFYSWPLASASSDTATLSYAIDAVGTGGTFQHRLSSQTVASIKPPPSGTTTKTITATI